MLTLMNQVRPYVKVNRSVCRAISSTSAGCIPNGAKPRLLMYTNANLLLDLCILLGRLTEGTN
jgi:hypothetical protein